MLKSMLCLQGGNQKEYIYILLDIYRAVFL